jgi:hypothetical protein
MVTCYKRLSWPGYNIPSPGSPGIGRVAAVPLPAGKDEKRNEEKKRPTGRIDYRSRSVRCLAVGTNGSYLACMQLEQETDKKRFSFDLKKKNLIFLLRRSLGKQTVLGRNIDSRDVVNVCFSDSRSFLELRGCQLFVLRHKRCRSQWLAIKLNSGTCLKLWALR